MVETATTPAPEQGEQAADLAALEAMAADGLPPPGHLSETEKGTDAGMPVAEVIGPALNLLTDGILKYYGLTPALSANEQAMMTGACMDTVNHYFPDLESVPVWASIPVAALIIAAPRLAEKTDREKEAAKKTKQDDGKPDPAPAPVPVPAPAQPDAMQAVGD